MDSHKISEAVTRMTWLDKVAEPWQDVVDRLYRAMGAPGQKLSTILNGKLLGHPLHAVLVHIPIGAWTLAAFIDLFGWNSASQSAAEWAVGFGLVVSIPTAITGSTDYRVYKDKSIQRIGALHGVINLVVMALYTLSLILRIENGYGAVFFGYLAFDFLIVSGYLGGLLVYEKRIGVNHAPEPEDEAAPDEFVPAIAFADLEENKPTKVRIQDVNVVLVRSGGQVYALADACAHMGASLTDGEFKNGCLECPWHKSCFRVTDGQPVEGPSVYAQATFPVVIAYGQVMVKAVRQEVDTVAEFPTPHGTASLR